MFSIYLIGNASKLNPLGGDTGVGSQLGRFTQLSASNTVKPRQTIKTRALTGKLVGFGKKQGEINITKPSFLVDKFMPLALVGRHCFVYPTSNGDKGKCKVNS